MIKNILKIKFAVLAMFLPIVSLAVTKVNPSSGSEAVTGTLSENIGKIINGALGIVGLIAVVMAVVGGIMLATSGGDDAKVTSGKNYITYGIIGLVVSLLAYAIVNFVIGIL